MFLFVGTMAYGQDLINVDVKIDTSKIVELIEKKDKEIENLKWVIAKKSGEVKFMGQQVKTANDSLHYYKEYYNNSKKIIGTRVIQKITGMIKEDK